MIFAIRLSYSAGVRAPGAIAVSPRTRGREPRVGLEEVERAVGSAKELGRGRVPGTGRGRDSNGTLVQIAPVLRGEARGGRPRPPPLGPRRPPSRPAPRGHRPRPPP